MYIGKLVRVRGEGDLMCGARTASKTARVTCSLKFIYIVIPRIVEIEFLAIFDHGNQHHTS